MPPFRLLDPDALALVAAHLAPDVDAYPAKLACRALRDAVRTHHGAATRTDAVAMATASVQRLQWAWRWAVPVSEAAAFDMALRTGRTKVARFLVRHGCATVTEDAYDLAACHGHADTARWAKSQLSAMGKMSIDQKRNNHDRQLSWVHRWTVSGRDFEVKNWFGLQFEACDNGNLEALTLVQDLGLGRFHMQIACSRGHVHVAKWLHEQGVGLDSMNWGVRLHHRCYVNWSPLFGYARRDWRPLFEWLHEQRVPWPDVEDAEDSWSPLCDILMESDSYYYQPIVRWLLERGYLNNHSKLQMCRRLVIMGDLDTLKVAHGFGVTPNHECMTSSAVEHGHLHVLWWALAQGCPADTDVCQKLARRGELGPLQLARAFDCPWDAFATAAAAEAGDVEVLRWLWENGCPRDERVLENATRLHRMEVLTWAAAHGFPWSAAARERLKTRQALREWAAERTREAPRPTKRRRE